MSEVEYEPDTIEYANEEVPEANPEAEVLEETTPSKLLPKDARPHFKGVFFDMFVEALDIDMAFMEAKEAFVNALVAKGIQVNADDFLSRLDLMKDRLMRVASLKRMTSELGLIAEYEKLLALEISYFESKLQAPSKPPRTVHPTAEGEKK